MLSYNCTAHNAGLLFYLIVAVALVAGGVSGDGNEPHLYVTQYERIISTPESKPLRSMEHGSNKSNNNASILVFGRSGSGVSSTVRMLLGSLAPPEVKSTGDAEVVVTEYFVRVGENPPSFFKVVDIDGVSDGRLPEEDAYIQASLKTYLTHPEGLNGQKPAAVLLLSPFDDTRYNDPESLYVKMIKRIADVEKSVYQGTIPDINILLFSRFMTEVKSIQRYPKKKLAMLQSAALHHVQGISPNIATLVGENRAEDYGLTRNENGTFKLPNRQLYPSNVFESISNLAIKNGQPIAAQVIKAFSSLRFGPKGSDQIASEIPFRVSPEPKDIDYFTRTIVRSGQGDIDDNQVNSAIQSTYENRLDANEKTRLASIVPTLQAFFQSLNITNLSDLPTTGLQTVQLYQSLPIAIQEDVVNLLQKSLNLRMPPFIQSLTVGHGYDLLKDEVLPSESIPFTPVTINTWKFSGMGYLLPSFLSCDKLPRDEIVKYVHFADDTETSVIQRQSYLHFPNRESLNNSVFEGQLRLGFNIKPARDDVPALSAVKEIRTHKMQLNDKVELNEEFKESVSLLRPFNSSDRESPKEWTSFFEKWGTHVVSSGFVGGFIQGTIISDDIRAAYQEDSEVKNVLEQIANFTQVNMTGLTFYGVFGGDKDPSLANVHELPESERNDVVRRWESSLASQPVVLNYQMELTPISDLVRQVDEGMSMEASRALDLFLQGNLKYVRAKRNHTSATRAPSHLSTTRKPQRRPTSSSFSQTPTSRMTSSYSVTSEPSTSPSVSSYPTSSFTEDTEDKTTTSKPSIPSFTGFTPPTQNTSESESLDGLPGNGGLASVLEAQLAQWLRENKYRQELMGEHMKSSAIQRENEMRAFERQQSIRREELERRNQELKERERQLKESRLRAEEARQREKEEMNQRQREQLEAEQRRRAEELEQFERKLNETTFVMQQLLRKQQEEIEAQKKKDEKKNLVQKGWDSFTSFFG